MTYQKTLSILSLIFLGLITACTPVHQQIKLAKASKPFIRQLNMSSAPETNNNAPVALDLVIAGHPVLARKLNTMTAAQFFKDKAQLKRDNPIHLKIRSFEIIPGQTIPTFAVPYPQKDVSAAFIFVRFNNVFPNRWRLLPADNVRIYIRDQDVQILSENDDTPKGKVKIPVEKPTTFMEDTIILQ